MRCFPAISMMGYRIKKCDDAQVHQLCSDFQCPLGIAQDHRKKTKDPCDHRRVAIVRKRKMLSPDPVIHHVRVGIEKLIDAKKKKEM